MKIIEIIIDPTGQVHLQTRGFAGSECRAASAEIEKAIGVVQSDQPTGEMYASSPAAVQQTTQS